MFFQKVRASKQKLEIDDPKPPKTGKVLSHYGEGSLSHQKYYIATIQVMEIMLLKALCEEDFGHEL